MNGQNRLNLPETCVLVTHYTQGFSSDRAVETRQIGWMGGVVSRISWLHLASKGAAAFGTERKCLANLASYLDGNSLCQFVSNTRNKQQPIDILKYTKSVYTAKSAEKQDDAVLSGSYASFWIGVVVRLCVLKVSCCEDFIIELICYKY